MDHRPISRMERRVHEFIARHIELHGESPTYGEIQNSVGIASKSTVAKALSSLSEHGLIRKEPRSRRGIVVLVQPEDREIEAAEDSDAVELLPAKRQSWLQREVHDYLSRYQSLYGRAPTFEEIQKNLRLSSKGSVAFAINALEAQGAIRRQSSRHRSIEVVEFPEHWNQQEAEIPLLGLIAAGAPIQAVPQADTLSVARDMLRGRTSYALRVQGDSMRDEGILDGDYLVIEARQTAVDGEIVVALIDDENATLKRFFREADRIRLEPANHQYASIYIAPPHRLRIQGVLRSVIRKY
ncbi:MAG: transcriptional repressor LexA [Acidobacteriota bacterium]